MIWPGWLIALLTVNCALAALAVGWALGYQHGRRHADNLATTGLTSTAPDAVVRSRRGVSEPNRAVMVKDLATALEQDVRARTGRRITPKEATEEAERMLAEAEGPPSL